MLKRVWVAVPSMVASALLVAPAAYAVDVVAGDWKLGVSGFASGYAQQAFCAHTDVKVAGGFACNTSVGGDDRAAVSNGLGVGHFGVNASTQKNGWDLGAVGEIWSGINSLNGGKTGFGETGPSMRQSYAFFGSEKFGSLKFGRMFGVFGSDAIANDMTLAGVGSGAAGVSGGVGNSTLGRIGVGYIFADFFPQIQYASPQLAGLQLTASIIQGFDAAPMAGVNGVTLVEHTVPGFMAKLTFDWQGALGGRAWASGWVQSAGAGAQKITSSAADLGARLDFKALSAVGYFFTGSGVGNTAAMRDGVALVNMLPAKRGSSGYYAQLTGKLGALKLGASYGACNLSLASGETGADQLVKSNSSIIGGAYYSLGDVVTLAAEWTTTSSVNHAGGKIQDNSVALGASAGF